MCARSAIQHRKRNLIALFFLLPLKCTVNSSVSSRVWLCVSLLVCLNVWLWVWCVCTLAEEKEPCWVNWFTVVVVVILLLERFVVGLVYSVGVKCKYVQLCPEKWFLETTLQPEYLGKKTSEIGYSTFFNVCFQNRLHCGDLKWCD